MEPRYKIVFLGGGTGQESILKGFRHKKQNFDVTSVVCMTDSGGSSGRIRRRLSVLPPGDFVKSMLALSSLGGWFNNVCKYRFHDFPIKPLNGHSIGNLFATIFIKLFRHDIAVTILNLLFKVNGKVIPVTKDLTELVVETNDCYITEEDSIDTQNIESIKNIKLSPQIRASRNAVRSVYKADAIVVTPGDLYTSILPVLIFDEIKEAIIKSNAKKIYVTNLFNKPHQTNNFSINDYLKQIYNLTGINFDTVICNNKGPSEGFFKKHIDKKNIQRVLESKIDFGEKISCDLLDEHIAEPIKGDVIERSYLRHDPQKVFNILNTLFKKSNQIKGFVFDFDRTICPCSEKTQSFKQLVIYKDSELLRKKLPYYISILTYGNKVSQRKKVLLSNILFDDLVIDTNRQKKKIIKIIKKYGTPLVFVDDKSSTLDAIRGKYSEEEIMLYHIIREDSLYKQKGEYNHTVINSLEPIFKLMKENNPNKQMPEQT